MTEQFEAFVKSGIIIEDKPTVLLPMSKALERDVRRYPQSLTRTGGENYAEWK